MLQGHNGHHYEQCISSTQTTQHTLFPYGAQRDSKTYLMRDEKRDGQMSKQKTASVSAGLRNTEEAGRYHWGRSNSKGRTHTHTQRDKDRGVC